MEITKGLGIAAVIIAVIGIFIPIIGVWLALAGIAAACITALRADRTFAVAVSVISMVNFYFLSPSLWLNNDFARTASVHIGFFSLSLGSVLMVAALLPLLAVMLNSKGIVSLGGSPKLHPDSMPRAPEAY